MGNNEELIKKVEQYEQDLKEGKKKSKKSVIRYILNISLVLIVTVVSIILSIWGKADTIWSNFMSADPMWIGVIVGDRKSVV